MNPSKMDALLALAEPYELPSLLRSITAFELVNMDSDEADAGRHRILVLMAFHAESGSSEPAQPGIGLHLSSLASLSAVHFREF